MRFSLVAFVAFVALASCSSSSKTFTLQAPGIAVLVHADPYSLEIRDGAGNVVLQSAAPGKRGDGYGALGWTSGSLTWGHNVSPGYFTMDPALDPWRDGLRIVRAVQPDPATLDVELASPTGIVRVHHSLRNSTLRVEASLTDAAAPRAWEIAWQTPSDEAFMGFGERYNRTNQRGLALYTWAEEGGLGESEATPKGPGNPWPNGETMTYYPVPFFLSSRGYGFWLDTTWRSEFDLASDRPDAWRAWHIGPSLAFEVYVPIPSDARPWPYQIIDEYTATTGRPMVPPPFAYGPRRRINVNAMQQGVLEIDLMRQLGLAITSADDTVHFLPAGSEFGQESSLQSWVAYAHQRGFVMDSYYNPYIVQSSTAPTAPDMNEGLAKNYFLRDAMGNPSIVWLISGQFVNVYTVDFTSPDASAWYVKLFDRALSLGYDGWMYDFGEYVQPEVVATDGTTGEELHNKFPLLYDKAAFDYLSAKNPRGFYFFARSGTTGSQQYVPTVWGGDPDASFDDANGLPAMIRGGLNLGVVGVANWGSDIGGYKCNGEGHAGANGELVTRWIEFGSTSPDMHDEDACSDAMDAGQKASIWTSPDAQQAWKTYAKLHTRMLPYYYTLAIRANATGTPILRTLFLETTERKFADVGDTYFVGPSLLASPVITRGATTKDVTFPDGKWLDWTDQVVIDGGATVTVPAPLAKLPLFLRDGALVPLLDPSIDTLADWQHPPVVGPSDVADVYDVVGFVSTQTGSASFDVWDGTTLAVTWQGTFAPGSLTPAADERALATCDGCFLQQSLGAGLSRVRVSARPGTIAAGGLTLTSQSSRRVRWDLFLVEP